LLIILLLYSAWKPCFRPSLSQKDSCAFVLTLGYWYASNFSFLQLCRRVANATNPGNTLYVTGLSSRVTERDLEDHFNKEGKVSSILVFCFIFSMVVSSWKIDIQWLFSSVGCFMFSCGGATYPNFMWFYFCYNGFPRGCWTLYEVSQSISFRGSLHHCRTGNMLLLLIVVDKTGVFFFLLNLKVLWLYSEYIASVMLATIRDDQFISMQI
jgi:hypothetical protein